MIAVMLLASAGLTLSMYADVPSSLLIAKQGVILRGHGDWDTFEFEIFEETDFAFYFASDYAATAAVFAPSQLDSFKSGRAFTAYELFDRQFGTGYPTLAPGRYYVGVRNLSDGENTYSVELDPFEGYKDVESTVYTGLQVSEATHVRGGSRAWVGFSIGEGDRVTVDGLNSGQSSDPVETYLIPASELSNFRSGSTFSYYPDYFGTSPALPGHIEINLPPGSYYYAFRNPGTIDRALVVNVYEWSRGKRLELVGPVSWRLTGDELNLKASGIEYRGGGSSGTLRIELWFADSPYSGGTLTGYEVGGYRFSDVLQDGTRYIDIDRTVAASVPPDGTYNSVMLLTEWKDSKYVVVDWINFDGTSVIGSGASGNGSGGGGGDPVVWVPVVSGLTASSDLSAHVALDWFGQGDQFAFNIYRSVSPEFFGTTLIAGSHRSAHFEDRSAEAGIDYRYWVTQVRLADGVEGQPSQAVLGRRATGGGNQQPPPVVTGVQATDGEFATHIRVTWDSVGPGYVYDVIVSTGPDDVFMGFRTAIGITEPVYLHFGNPDSGPLYFTVDARHRDEILGTPGGGDYGFQGSPIWNAGVTATDGASTEYVRVSWKSLGPGYRYTVYRSESLALSSASAVGTGLQATEFLDREVEPGHEHFYWVAATNPSNQDQEPATSPDSGFRSPWGLELDPRTPTAQSLAATKGAFPDAIEVSWDRREELCACPPGKSPPNYTYSVFRSKSDDFGDAIFLAESDGDGPIFRAILTDDTASPGIIYRYWVLLEADNRGIFSLPGDPVVGYAGSLDIDPGFDPWVTGFGLPIDARFPWSDPDGDGFDNASEFKAKTDPSNKGSFLRILRIAYHHGARNLTLAWSSVASVRYQVEEWQEPLGDWVPSSGELIGSDGTTTHSMPKSPDADLGIFRVRVID